MAQIEVTEESLRTAVDEDVFAQAVALADKVAGFSAVGPQIEAIVDGTEVSVRVKPFGLEARCACPAPYQDGAPCPHAVAAVLTWVRAGPDPAAELRAELDDVLAGLAAEAGDCDPDDGWYPDTSDLEDLLDEVEDLAGEAPEAARELAGHAAARIREVLAAGNCLTDDLADTLTRAEELRGDAALHSRAQQRGAEPEAGPGPGVPGLPPLPLPLRAGPDDRRALQPVQLVGRPLHHAERHGHPGRALRSQRSVGRFSLQAAVGDGIQQGGHPGADLARRAHASLVPGRGRQRGRLVAGPVPGEQRVQHPGQRRGVGGYRVLSAASGTNTLTCGDDRTKRSENFLIRHPRP